VRRQRQLAVPLLDLTLFRSRSLSTALGVTLAGGIAIGGTFLFVSQYLQLVAGLCPLHAGLWLMPATVSMIVGTLVGPVVLRRLQPGAVLATGLSVAALGALLLLTVNEGSGAGLLIAAFSVFFFGMGLPGGLGIELVLTAAPPEKAGAAAALSEITQELGLALGLALLGSLGTAVARSGDSIGMSLSGALHAVATTVVVLLVGLVPVTLHVLRTRVGASPVSR
jgi:DHA2 family multidrug resistance protein-like MFS transporter